MLKADRGVARLRCVRTRAGLPGMPAGCCAPPSPRPRPRLPRRASIGSAWPGAALLAGAGSDTAAAGRGGPDPAARRGEGVTGAPCAAGEAVRAARSQVYCMSGEWRVVQMQMAGRGHNTGCCRNQESGLVAALAGSCLAKLTCPCPTHTDGGGTEAPGTRGPGAGTAAVTADGGPDAWRVAAC